MQSLVQQSKTTIPLRNYKNADYTNKKCNADVFDLIEEIPKTIKVLNVEDLESEDLFLIIEKCALFLIEKNAKVYNSLEFNLELHTPNDVAVSLIDAIISTTNVVTLIWEPSYRNVLFLYEIDFSLGFYILEGKYINRIKSEPLKIGFAHLLYKFQNTIDNSQFKYSGCKEDSLFDPIIELFSDEEEGESDSYNSNIIDNHINNTVAIMKSVLTYYNKDFAIYKDFKPKIKSELELKIIIDKLFTLDSFGCWNEFADSMHDDEEYLFSNLFWAITDLNDAIESRYIEEEEQMIYQVGISEPNGYYYLDEKNKIINATPKQKINNLNQFCSIFNKLNFKLTKNYGN